MKCPNCGSENCQYITTTETHGGDGSIADVATGCTGSYNDEGDVESIWSDDPTKHGIEKREDGGLEISSGVGQPWGNFRKISGTDIVTAKLEGTYKNGDDSISISKQITDFDNDNIPAGVEIADASISYNGGANINGILYTQGGDGTVAIIDETTDEPRGIITFEDARKKLKKTYSEEIPVSEGFALWNLEKKREVWCFIKNDEVNQITYHALTEGDVKRYEEDVAGEYVFKDSDKKYLSKDEVKSVDSSMLNIGKNEIYARHGYIFADENLKQYFEEKLWYKGEVTADQFDENQLNSFEKKNIELINTIEAKENQMSDSTDTQIENINSFVGEEGTYYSGNVGEAEDADAGRIDVWREDNDIYLAIGSSKDFPILNGSGNGIKGIIRNKNTVIIKDGDKLMFSLVWHDKGSFTITRFQNTGSELLDMINIDTPYVNAKYYGVSD